MASYLYRKYKTKEKDSQIQVWDHEASGVANSPRPESENETSYERETLPRNSKCTICTEEKRSRSRYRQKLMAGLLLPFTLQALDVTIVSGALPYIASDFNKLSQLNWIVSAFNLCSATFIPAWGQCSDVFGRYETLQASVWIMLIGNALCSAAPVSAFPMLLVGRALQGIGCSGIDILTKVILADKVSLEENANNNTLFTLIGGVGYGIGPVIGGYLTQISWRWCFIINIPIGVVGSILVHFVLRHELLGPQKVTRTDGTPDTEIPSSFLARLSTIDLGGQFLFLFGMGLLVLSLTWAGSFYPWSNVRIIVPLVFGLVLLVTFVGWEYLMIPGSTLAKRYPYKQPMIPIKLLCTRNVGILIYINLTTGMAIFAVFYFVDLYFALVLQYPSSKAGINLLYYLPGLGAGAFLAIFTTTIYPRTTFPPLLLGTILEPVGITILAIALQSDKRQLIFGMIALTGVGTGIRFMPGTLHGIGYHPDQIAAIVSLMMLASSLGGTLATTVMLNILNSRMGAEGIGAGGGSLNAIQGLSKEAQGIMREQAREGIVVAFLAISAFLWLGVIVGMCFGNVKIGKAGKPSSVVKGTYIGSLFRSERSVDEKA